jgi:hypothetical protein
MTCPSYGEDFHVSEFRERGNVVAGGYRPQLGVTSKMQSDVKFRDRVVSIELAKQKI